MRITRLYLRNYRVYEDELNLELPPGLVGILGANGAGKSLLIESVLWTLWGYARTAKEEVRTAGVNAECVTEVEFEHEGHLYLVRRTLSGVNATVRASAEADGLQVAEGVKAVGQYVHSVLGMDAAAFRASVFAEQKQLAAFSGQRPAERRDLVLRLLGITPLDKARDAARTDARVAKQAFEQLRRLLPDLEPLEIAAADAAAAAGALAADAEREEATAVAARRRLSHADDRVAALEDVRREHERLVAEGMAVRAEHDAAAAETDRLAAELAALEAVAAELTVLRAEAAGLEAAQARLQLVQDVAAAEQELARLPTPAPPALGTEEAYEQAWVAARAAAEADGGRLAEVGGLLRGAEEDHARALHAVGRSGELSGEADCPLCGQALGSAFERVQAHRAAELDEAARRRDVLAAERARLAAVAEASRGRAEAAAAELAASREAWSVYGQQRARREAAEAALATARARLGPGAAGEGPEQLAEEVERMRAAAERYQRGRGRLERRPAVEAALDAASSRMANAAGRRDVLLDKVRSLGFQPEQLAEAQKERADLATAAERASGAAMAVRVAAAQAAERAGAAARELAGARDQHAALEARADDARHLGRLAELLAAFRNTVVAAVGPRLSTGAAELFAELTDHEYDRLEVDPETYEIQIRDGGRLYGMDRFSGSEIDLANLALRVAISEHVRLLSGGAVGLLVLDEVFGPLDEDRKARMLAALERLRGRFRQMLVVTHDDSTKAELPNAVEVVKLPGRRATARLVHS